MVGAFNKGATKDRVLESEVTKVWHSQQGMAAGTCPKPLTTKQQLKQVTFQNSAAPTIQENVAVQ